MRPLIIAINGILTRQTVAAWPDRFDAWCERERVEAKVLKKEYIAGPFPLWNTLVRNWLIARGLAAEIELFCDQHPASSTQHLDLHFIAHSNGTDVALKTIRLLADRGIPTATFIAIGSVLKSDIVRSRVLDLLHEGDLGRAVAYSSPNDLAIKWGRWSLGYGGLGREGWKCWDTVLPSVKGDEALSLDIGNIYTRWFRGGHGSYFTENPERTFALIRKDCGLFGL